jgi:hypothetical protein
MFFPFDGALIFINLRIMYCLRSLVVDIRTSNRTKEQSAKRERRKRTINTSER